MEKTRICCDASSFRCILHCVPPVIRLYLGGCIGRYLRLPFSIYSSRPWRRSSNAPPKPTVTPVYKIVPLPCLSSQLPTTTVPFSSSNLSEQAEPEVAGRWLSHLHRHAEFSNFPEYGQWVPATSPSSHYGNIIESVRRQFQRGTISCTP